MLKGTLDLLLALLAFVLFSPHPPGGRIARGREAGQAGPFKQTRPGRHGKPFRLVKFRSMTDTRDERGQQLPDAERLPPFGRFLRASSLDELPEIWNVLLGDMSIVGPRPLLMDYLPLYSAIQRRRHEVRPGITGWAQINGRNSLSWQEKFEFDVWYVDHQCFTLDLKIFWITFARIALRSGITSEQSGV